MYIELIFVMDINHDLKVSGFITFSEGSAQLGKSIIARETILPITIKRGNAQIVLDSFIGDPRKDHAKLHVAVNNHE